MVAEPSRASAAATSSELMLVVLTSWSSSVGVGRVPVHWSTGRGHGTSRTLPGVPDDMLIVTQVAPYADGPAGVHGVLGQAATGLRELAGLAGLVPHRGRPTSATSRPTDLAAARVLALFTIGETPWSADAEGRGLPSPGRTAACASSACTPPPTPTTAGPSTAPCSAPASTAIPGPRTSPSTWSTPTTPPPRTSAHGGSGDDEVYLFADLRPDARVLLRLAEDQVDLSAPGRPRARRAASPSPGAWRTGAARTFYSALGHFPGAWETPAYLRHLAGGLAWLAESA